MIEIDPNQLYRVPQVAKILGMSQPTVRQLLTSRQLETRVVRPGGHPRVPGHSILGWIQGNSERD